jgi:hypothetical protein
MSVALQEVMAEYAANQSGERTPVPRGSLEAIDPRRVDPPKVGNPSAQVLPHSQGQPQSGTQPGAPGTGIRTPIVMGQGVAKVPQAPTTPLPLTPAPGGLAGPLPHTPLPHTPLPHTPLPHAQAGTPYNAGPNHAYAPGGSALSPHAQFPQPTPYPQAPSSSMTWLWWLLGLLVLGAGFGALVAVLIS